MPFSCPPFHRSLSHRTPSLACLRCVVQVPEPFATDAAELQTRTNTFAGVGSVEAGVSDQDCLADTYVYDLDNKV